MLGGPKVRSFYANISGDQNAVTVDAWAQRIAGYEYPNGLAPNKYDHYADAYRDAARRAGESPATMQAITWIAYRRQHLSAAHRRFE